MSGGGTHCYSVHLTAGQYARVVVDQRGVDLVITFTGPSGRELVRVDNQNATHGPETVSFVAESQGDYLLRVKKLIGGSIDGRYAVRFQELRAATIADRELVSAERELAEAQQLLELGDAASLLRAVEKFEQVAPVFKASGDTYQHAFTLYILGSTLFSIDRVDEALRYYGESLALFGAAGDSSGQAAAYGALAQLYLIQGRTSDALESFDKALSLSRHAGNDVVVASALIGLGHLHYVMGARKRALENYDEALRLSKKTKYATSQATTLLRIARCYAESGRTERALRLYDQALGIYTSRNNSRGVAATYRGMALAHFIEGDEQAGFDLLNKSLALAKKNGDLSAQMTALADTGWMSQLTGDNRKAVDKLSQALAISREVRDRKNEAIILENMMFAWKSRGNAELAIFYGKQAVNIYQEVRANSQTLEADLQKSFLQSKENVYRGLADLLIEKGRLFEAQRVLEMLKQDEYFKYLRRQSTGKAHSVRTPLSEKEKTLEALESSLVNIDRAIRELEGVEDKTDEQKKLLERLRKELREGKERFEEALQEARDEAASTKDSESQRQGEQIERAEPLNLGPGVVRLDTVKTEKSYRVMLFTSGVPIAGKSDIKESVLNRKIMKFREALQDPTTTEKEFLPLAQDLYNILVGPVANDLKATKAKTLLWSFDGALRYVPVAVLHDGEKYLVERYRNVVLTPATLPRLANTPSLSPQRALGLGVSLAYGNHPGLPGVEEELSGIIRDPADLNARGALPGVILLNGKFTEGAMMKALQEGYTVIHIASHFELEPGTAEKPYLLLGDGRHLAVSNIFSDSWKVFSGVDLLTLSACNTAIDDPDAEGAELENFGLRAQDEGAQTVVATLWSVADFSTSKLMREFYRVRSDDPEMSKAEALRVAQLSLLYGSEAGEGELRGADAAPKKVGYPASPLADKSQQRPYSHPYFWAPFVLIGNWR